MLFPLSFLSVGGVFQEVILKDDVKYMKSRSVIWTVDKYISENAEQY